MTESNAVHVEVPEGHVMVVGHDGEPIGTVPAAMVQQPTEGEDEARGVTDLVEQPAKVMRIGSMIRQLLEEVKSAPLDEASRARLRDIHHASIKELETGLAPELIEELERIALPFTDDATPSDGELRIAQAQLVGWLEGLFHGIQTAIYAQQMASRAQLEQMRRALPALQAAVEQGRAGVPGQPGHPGQPGQPGQPSQGPAESGGMYL
ncbi:bacterial proteasome activator family protein [Nocardioides houyundeii]|uniref:bacterial proteasome activator family protein n=1 Tax=Nocardioides houyundeii TaxID=2045452 RepID=UPI0023DD1F89|nr:bacterial proteasome activator family protein [Nocardioides houyundeii]